MNAPIQPLSPAEQYIARKLKKKLMCALALLTRGERRGLRAHAGCSRATPHAGGALRRDEAPRRNPRSREGRTFPETGGPQCVVERKSCEPSGALVEKVNGYVRRVEAETGAKIARAQAAEALIKLGLSAVSKTVDPLAQLAAAERKK